jgi:hypothetical protein
LAIVSDGVTSLHGMWPASMEWFAPWKSIDGCGRRCKQVPAPWSCLGSTLRA